MVGLGGGVFGENLGEDFIVKASLKVGTKSLLSGGKAFQKEEAAGRSSGGIGQRWHNWKGHTFKVTRLNIMGEIIEHHTREVSRVF